MTTLNNYYRYILYCETEGKNVITILSDTKTPAAPSSCPNDAGHIINSNSVSLLDVSYEDETVVNQNKHRDLTNNNYAADSVIINVPEEDTVTVHNTSFPMDIYMVRARFKNHKPSRGDNIKVYLNPDTNMGNIGGVLNTGTNIIDVSATQIKNIQNGFYIKVTEGSDTSDMGRVTNIDWVNNQITMENNSSHTFTTAATMHMSIKFCDIQFDSDGINYDLGNSNLRGVLIPKNNNICVMYYNLTQGQKNITFTIEYLY